MNPDQLLEHFDRISETPDAISRLRRFILDLAVRGKLVEQDPNDEPAAELLKRIAKEKALRVKSGILREPKPMPPIESHEIEFELAQGWQWVRMAEVIKLWNGFAFKSVDFQSIGVPVIRISDLQDGEVTLSGVVCVSEAVAKTVSDEIWIPLDALLIAMSGATTGKTAFNRSGKSLLLNQRVGRIEVFSMSANFLRFFFETIVARNLSISFGTAIPNLSSQQINETVVPLPPLAEQHRIVAKVDELMTLCDKLEAAKAEREKNRDRLVSVSLQRLNQPSDNEDIFRDDARFIFDNLPRLTTRPAHIKQLRQIILGLAFKGYLSESCAHNGDGLDLLEKIREHWRVKTPKSKKSKTLLNSDLFDCEPAFSAPKSWGWARLETLCEQIGDIDHKMPRAVPIGVMFLSAKDLKDDGDLDFSDPKFISEEDFLRLSRKILPVRDDIIYSRIGARLGKARLVKVDARFLISYSCCLIRPLHQFINKHYLQTFLDSHLALQQAHFGVKSIGVPDLGLGEIKAYRVPLPPLVEQHRIVAKVDELMTICDKLEAQLTITEANNRRLLEAVLYEALSPALAEA
jgi:type I restriction enzyme, S subunit